MFICEIWLFDWYFPQFFTSDMSKYGYLEVSDKGLYFVSIQLCLDFYDDHGKIHVRKSTSTR